MIVTERRPRWLYLILRYRGTELERIKFRLIAVGAVALFVSLAHDFYGLFPQTLTATPFTLVGVALGIFLGFRNNTSYDRFWEGRRLWGALVNVARTFCRQCQTLVSSEEAGPGQSSAHQVELVMRAIAFVHALRIHLRGDKDWTELQPFLGSQEVARLKTQHNIPAAITLETARALRRAFDEGLIHPHHLPLLDQSLTEMTSIQGGCERIKGTPIPFSYTVLIHRIVAVYCFALPLGVVDMLHFWTTPVVLFVAYAFLGLDAIGEELEDPFGTDSNDLPLSALSRTIEVNLRQLLGQTDVPTLLEPQDGILR